MLKLKSSTFLDLDKKNLLTCSELMPIKSVNAAVTTGFEYEKFMTGWLVVKFVLRGRACVKSVAEKKIAWNFEGNDLGLFINNIRA